MVQFVNQDQCLRDVVRMAQAKWTVRMTMMRGDWYNALMGMSTVFKQLTAVEQQCRLVRKGYRRRYLASYTCESSTLYAQSAGVMMVMSAEKENGEKFFYYAAQAYRGMMGMGQKCHSMRQTYNAFTRGEVILGRKLIAKKGGNYNQCMRYYQTGYDHYMNFLNQYMKMSITGMEKYMVQIYDWESQGMNICLR
jgi:hypothetical protein